jgi:hypothetical protein
VAVSKGPPGSGFVTRSFTCEISVFVVLSAESSGEVPGSGRVSAEWAGGRGGAAARLCDKAMRCILWTIVIAENNFWKDEKPGKRDRF